MWLSIRALLLAALLLLLPALAVQAADGDRHCRMETATMATTHVDTYACDVAPTNADMLDACKQLPNCIAGGTLFDSVAPLHFPAIASRDVTLLPHVPSALHVPDTFWRPPRRA